MATRVGDLMSRSLDTCPPDASIAEAARMMRDDDVGDIVVVDQDGTLFGIVTDRDIAIRAVAEGRDPTGTTVGDIASRDLATVTPDDRLDDAARVMRERAIRRLPVTEGRRPVGIISIGDLAFEEDPDSALADISAERGNR